MGSITVSTRTATGCRAETRGVPVHAARPVVHRPPTGSIVRAPAGDGEYRAGEQFLRMMRAKSLAEWKDAMRMRARTNSSFTYADRAGNIFNLWNAAMPLLPHPSGGDRRDVRRTGG